MTSHPPRILHVISSLDGGGAQRVLLTTLAGLIEATQSLALGRHGILSPLIPAAVPVSRASTEIELTDVMTSFRPDVVHTWLDDSLLLAILPAARLGIPVVHRLYNVPSVLKAFEPGGPGHNEMMARALSAADRVIALSDTAADDAVEFYGIQRPTVIYNGFPLVGRRGGQGCRVEKVVGRLVILNVARFAPQKGHAFLLDAMARLSFNYPHVELWLAGIGEEESHLRAQALSAGIADRVHFLGFQEDVAALHALADIFVFPSIFEGFGNALAEAMLAGLPIVASDLPVIRRDVLRGSSGAALVPPGNSAALADTLEHLIVNAEVRKTLGAAARVAANRFAVSSMLDGFRSVYAELTKDRRAAA